MQGRSQILDLGRRTRTVPDRLRRADRAPRPALPVPGLPGTGVVVRRHHLVLWTRGGETNVENLALLCRRHHVAVHEGGWKLARGPDGLTLAA